MVIKMNEYIKTNKYDKNFISENMMGPNSLKILEELTNDIPLKKGMKVLDLGCGRGLTSIFLANEFDVEVYAVDLWTSPTDNYNRFKAMGLENKIIPLCFDASKIPFANEYFDAVISVDSYHYFGNNQSYFGDYIAPILKKDGIFAIAIPSIRQDFTFENIPEEMKPFWEKEAFYMWRSTNWWKNIFEKHLNNFEIKEMECFDDAWNDWLSTDNPFAVSDKDMIKADGGRYMNIISVTGNLKQN